MTRFQGAGRGLAALAACLYIGVAVPEATASPPRAPNIIFIMADDLGKGLLPLYNDAQVYIATPNIDRLADEGVVFDNAYATPMCLTTRTELITGRYPTNNGIAGHTETFDHIFLDSHSLPSFAVPLRRAGYATAVVGKWHGKARYQTYRVLRAFGFEQWMSTASLLDTSARTSEGLMYFDPGDFPADRLADFAVGFIRENRHRPFFLYYPMDLIHKPLVATPDKPQASSETEKLIAMTEYADKMVGRVLDAIETNGLRDNTIVFFSGDNGLALAFLNPRGNRASALDAVWNRLREWIGGQRQEWRMTSRGKNMLTEAGVNVPLIVGGGPVMRRGRTDALTDFTDVLPTLAALAGAPLPDDCAPDGHSIADFLFGQAEDTPRQWIASAAAVHPLFNSEMFHQDCYGQCTPLPPQQGLDRWYWRAQDIGVVVRDKRYKLWHHGNGFRALFDLQADPSETVNLWEQRRTTGCDGKAPVADRAAHLASGRRVRAGPAVDTGLRIALPLAV